MPRFSFLDRALTLALAAALGLAGCGGSAPSPGGNSTAQTAPSPGPAPQTCSLRTRQDWAAAQLREWYLFPETLPASLDPSAYTSVTAYIDALTATARGQGRDRFFTYLTSIAEENAFNNSGATAAFGIRIQTDAVARRVLVADAYEGAPALAAGLDRGTEILAIGTTMADMRSVNEIIITEGSAGVSTALGPSTAGVTRLLRINDSAGSRFVSVTKAEFSIAPVSSRFGTRIIDNDGTRVGYINLRTFISTADPALRAAFADFRAQGISQFIVDFRYNGGGLVSIAELMGDLLGDNRSAGDVYNYTSFRPEKSSSNRTRQFNRQAQSVAPVKIAFIATSASASASELVINAFIPYLRANAVLVGGNTFGKPVGQIGLDLAACDDRLRVVAFATQNSERAGNYYNGLAGTIAASCKADDQLGLQMGDPQEASTRGALDALAGRSCAPISSEARAQSVGGAAERKLLVPDRLDSVQREVPGTW